MSSSSGGRCLIGPGEDTRLTMREGLEVGEEAREDGGRVSE